MFDQSYGKEVTIAAPAPQPWRQSCGNHGSAKAQHGTNSGQEESRHRYDKEEKEHS
jgi:hypothetical protein